MESIGVGKNVQVATAMAMAGRSARPCDVCGRDRARWYCAADEAYLCDRCDGSVHSANTVALRHERVRVSPHGLPSRPSRRSSSPSAADKITRSSSSGYGWQQSRSQYKKPRSSRPHPHSVAFSVNSRASSTEAERDQMELGVVKEEPSSPVLMQPSSPMSQPFLYDRSKLLEADESEAAHEVPVLLTTKQEFEFCPRSLADCTILVGSLSSDAIPSYDALGFLVPDADSSMDRFLSSDAEFQRESKMQESIISCEKASFSSELPLMDDLEVLGLCGGHDLDVVYSMDLSSMKEFREEEAGGSDDDGDEDEVEGISGGEVSMGKVKMEEECSTWWEDGLEGVKIEVDEMFACDWNGWHEEELELEVKQKISLSLNYDDVLSAWSDRGSLWADGRRPQIVPDCPSYETSAPPAALDSGYLDIGLVPDINFCSAISTSGEQLGQVPVVSNVGEDSRNVGEREARVMRYREKRRTRLFSKKIRYEVRKLNAERRPRLKGRFVKKTTSCS